MRRARRQLLPNEPHVTEDYRELFDDVDAALRTRFDERRIPVAGVRHVRVWGLQVDDERVLPGMERTQMADEEIWEVNLEAKNGSKYEFESRLLKPASDSS